MSRIIAILLVGFLGLGWVATPSVAMAGYYYRHHSSGNAWKVLGVAGAIGGIAAIVNHKNKAKTKPLNYLEYRSRTVSKFSTLESTIYSIIENLEAGQYALPRQLFVDKGILVTPKELKNAFKKIAKKLPSEYYFVAYNTASDAVFFDKTELPK